MQQETQAASNNQRESLWSVPPGFWVLYFVLFALLDAAGVGYAVWHEIRYGAGENIHAHISAIIPQASAIGVRAAITGFTLTEALRIAMIISNYLKMRLLKPEEERIKARGLAEGQKRVAEASRKLTEWNERRLAAQELGVPFDEPMPDPPRL